MSKPVSFYHTVYFLLFSDLMVCRLEELQHLQLHPRACKHAEGFKAVEEVLSFAAVGLRLIPG